jgi:septal ring-binding cell division protein DamX
VLPSFVALLVAAGGATIAIVGSNEAPARASRAIIATSRLEPASPPRSAPPAGSARHSSKQKLITWPDTSGYTLILSTVPLSAGPQQAKRRALAALREKLPDVGVLVSTSYASLHPGYYVVFSGIYASREEAQADLLAARRYFPAAYPSPVVR